MRQGIKSSMEINKYASLGGASWGGGQKRLWATPSGFLGYTYFYATRIEGRK